MILFGILISQIGVLRQTRRRLALDNTNVTQAQQVETEMGFKGI